MDICDQARTAIEDEIPGATVEVTGSGGHFVIRVVSEAFAGKRIVAKQRMVYKAITHLMAGDMAPIHAVDQLICETP